MYKLTLIAAAVLCSANASDAIRELQYQGDLAPRNISPTFDHGYLAVYDTGGAASIYSREGTPVYTNPKPDKGFIANLAVDDDGVSAAAISYHTHGAIAVTAADGSTSNVIQAPGFVPSYVTFAPDHSI